MSTHEIVFHTFSPKTIRQPLFKKTSTNTPPPSHSPEEGKILRASALISGATFLSRILGFIRDIVLARLFGASLAADAFFVAYRIPNMLRELFAEGSMSAAFIPVFSEYVKRHPHKIAKDLANTAFTTFLLILTTVCILGVLGAPIIVDIMAMGFADNPEKRTLTIELTRMMFPYLIFIGLSALAMGILNTIRSFGAPAFAPVIFNLTIIASAFLLAPQLSNPIYAIAIGVTLGGAAQFLFQLPSLTKHNFSLSFHWDLQHTAVKKIGKLILPTIFGLGVTQINLLINTILASFLATGSITFLFYGMRLIHFPLGLVGIALATAILPSLSSVSIDGTRDELSRRIEFGLRHVFFLMLPATIGLIMLRTPLIQLFFEHGEFTSEATHGTAQAVLFYALGLWAFGAIRIIVSAFYALQDTLTPVRIAVVALLCNLIFSLLLIGPLKHGGLALATSLATTINVTILIFILTKRIGPLNWGSLVASLFRTTLGCSAVILICQWAADHTIWTDNATWSAKALLLASAVLFSITGYFGIHLLLRSSELIAIKDALVKKQTTNK